MKYMGHKGRILGPITEAVGSLLSRKCRIADLFCGSGIVSWHFASAFPNSVWASDLQKFACARAAAVLERRAIPPEHDLERWLARAAASFEDSKEHLNGSAAGLPGRWDRASAQRIVFEHRSTAESLDGSRLGCVVPAVTKAYGGYYFSVSQSMRLDALRSTLPLGGDSRRMALSSLVGAASQCSASPGHTAQPFQPTHGAARWLLEAWKRDPTKYLRDEWHQSASFRANSAGKVFLSDASELLGKLDPGDVAFLDPPYSGVHYSRFYHVLETLADGELTEVGGTGRYPAPRFRPVSEFSQRGNSRRAIEKLIFVAAERKIRLVVTFPFEQQSNGLAASIIESLAKNTFDAWL
jgi:adenine-specific DNA-methyltransferase